MNTFTNMNKRDKNMLLLLLVVIVFYVSYTYIITPAMEASNTMKAELIQVQSDTQRAEQLAASEMELREKSVQLKQEIEDKYNIYLKSLNQAQILAKMDARMQDVNFDVDRYVPSESIAMQVPLEQGMYEALKYPLLNMAKEINKKIADEASQDAGEVMVTEGEFADMIPVAEIAISFNDATYGNMYDFIKSVEELDKTIHVKSIVIEGNGDKISGDVSFSLMGLPPINEEKMVDYPLTPLIPKGKANPFA